MDEHKLKLNSKLTKWRLLRAARNGKENRDRRRNRCQQHLGDNKTLKKATVIALDNEMRKEQDIMRYYGYGKKQRMSVAADM